MLQVGAIGIEGRGREDKEEEELRIRGAVPPSSRLGVQESTEITSVLRFFAKQGEVKRGDRDSRTNV
jgi:hypothetical protein